MRFPPFVISLLTAITVLLCACTDDSPNDSHPTPPPDTAKSLWQNENDSEVVAIPHESDDKELVAAIAEARRTADAARTRWTAASPDERNRWSVKWAAPTANDEVEHVWVQPINWSAFRIEGILLSKPVAELANARTLGEIVSFPIDELTDWLHFTSSNPNPTSADPHEGGYTVKLLEARFGKPTP